MTALPLPMVAATAAMVACTPAPADFASMSTEQALERCGAVFDDFVWRHDISGTIFVTIARPGRPAAGKVECMDRWASSTRRPHIFDGGTRPVGRPDILKKAAICGLDPERDLAWTGPGRGGAVAQDRGASIPAIKCLLDWADFVDAPVDLPPSKS